MMKSKEWLADVAGVQIRDSDSLQADACGPSYKYDSHTRLQLERKDAMRARGVPSSDEWNAVALTFAEPVRDRLQGFDRVIEYPRSSAGRDDGDSDGFGERFWFTEHLGSCVYGFSRPTSDNEITLSLSELDPKNLTFTDDLQRTLFGDLENVPVGYTKVVSCCTERVTRLRASAAGLVLPREGKALLRTSRLTHLPRQTMRNLGEKKMEKESKQESCRLVDL